LSASISCSEALEAIRRGERLPHSTVRALADADPAAFFRTIVEALADSFDPAQSVAYEILMSAWIPSAPHVARAIFGRVDKVYVLSRVTLGADIKITSAILDAMKKRFVHAEIIFVANWKSADLFAADPRVTHLNADYPRSGSVAARIQFAHDLRHQLGGKNRIVIDPDSRTTQLGLVPVCEPEHYFHFPSRTASWSPNLTGLTQTWLLETFGETGEAYIAPHVVPIEGYAPRVAVSLGVGENEAKRIQGDFETQLIRTLGEKFATIWIDRGAGGEEAQRVTAAAQASGYQDRIRFWEGSFAGFASLIAQSDLYIGYDSAGQHAAAATGTPLITVFAGAPSARFQERWQPQGKGLIEVIEADEQTLRNVRSLLSS
jgi:Glycosyltransferase family 9 (heptosyltransferase)